MTQPLDKPQPTVDLTAAQAAPEPTIGAVAQPPRPEPQETGAAPRVPRTEPPPGGDSMRTCGPASAADGGTLPQSASTSMPAGRGQVGVPGYEILGELGRGGMGVVYRARQIKANRVVALKMILIGGHAGTAELARFQTEAQAIAALQHPHIVQVFEVGEHDGLPFFSLELCDGGSLDRKLAGTPLPAMEAARLVETLARAMHAAHQAGVIHRDLKPANVLLLEDGTPKITDFGLAKKLDDAAGQTQSGAIVGTPSYMAPEQASGKNKELGPAADIYALGAILYEVLTGRPPFKAATPLDTILQVISDEPVPPSQLQSKTPRDLETICLKCLQKEPGKRYASALSLAEDLGRYQRGEPIAARPVGRLERTWRWCRRNPAVASLSAAVLLAMLAGTAISWGFAIEANRRADAEASAKDAEKNAREAETEAKKTALHNEEKAKQEKAAAVAARNDLEKANTELTRSQEALLKSSDNLVTSVARSLLRPMASQIQDHPSLSPLSDPEIESLWELASSKEDRLRLRFVEEALRGPVFTRQLKDRAAVALQAAVGLNGTRRTQVEALLGKRLKAKAIPQEQQEDVALCLAHLGILDRLLAGRTAATLTQALSKTTDLGALVPLSQGLSAVAARMEPKEVAEAAATLTQALSKPTGTHALQSLSQGLSAVVARLKPKAAAEAAATLTQAMTKTTNYSVMQYLSQGVSALAARLEPKEAAEAAATLTQVLSKWTDYDSKTTNYMVLVSLSQGLSAVAARMEPKAAAQACGQAAATLMSKTTVFHALHPLSQGLLAVLSREASMTTRQRSVSVTATIAGLPGPGTPFAALACSPLALEPLPPPLLAQTLVDLLKHPLCVGEPRRLVLEQLARHFNRPFADQWEFVEYVHQHKLDLDLTTPPQRPELAAAGPR